MPEEEAEELVLIFRDLPLRRCEDLPEALVNPVAIPVREHRGFAPVDLAGEDDLVAGRGSGL